MIIPKPEVSDDSRNSEIIQRKKKLTTAPARGAKHIVEEMLIYHYKLIKTNPPTFQPSYLYRLTGYIRFGSKTFSGGGQPAFGTMPKQDPGIVC